MTIDLASLSSKELDTLITKAKKRKVALKKRKPAAAVRRTARRRYNPRPLPAR